MIYNVKNIVTTSGISVIKENIFEKVTKIFLPNRDVI